MNIKQIVLTILISLFFGFIGGLFGVLIIASVL
ncbi:hypothetical protein IANJMKHF_00284 [Klebsiella phage CPRSA]|nr:hypothetical protein [Klebsiella phage vB_KpnM_VAC13]UQJ95190.1 hypothetical protein IANJMKHF_00284 [Klebsiella phage CPRSA]WDQ26409.1 hypothetical protein phiKPNS3_00143 [Klebsiella phage phi_KPN_S3]WMX18109.1 hypothetical protein [Klebsiella phage KpF2]